MLVFSARQKSLGRDRFEGMLNVVLHFMPRLRSVPSSSAIIISQSVQGRTGGTKDPAIIWFSDIATSYPLQTDILDLY
ncbi:hypothetical protein BT69DRAFT_453762 [Atractiella rhizophila]|nr:hypothetical protein BT69DRAFT_576456 [Atractiella rhizophila]KAH8919984.1 hypothetical protein BT69DRAFT_453762 [Atractiella rhizophila]